MSYEESSALYGRIESAIAEVFKSLDESYEKADILDASWAKVSLDSISRSCYRILRITANQALYSRLKSGNLGNSPTKIDLFFAMDDWKDTISYITNKIGVPITFDLPNCASGVELDDQDFGSIFANILHNSLYFTRPGNEISVRGEIVSNFATLKITDKGMGISDDLLPKVTLPFVSHGEGERHEGMGLGLALCDMFMRSQNGNISIESRLGEGTSMKLTFPRKTNFSRSLSLRQSSGLMTSDQFSPLYIGILDASLSPYADRGDWVPGKVET